MKIKRIFSIMLVLLLMLTAVPLTASAASATFTQIVNAATYIIVINEGNYTTVVRNDNGALSIGKIGWHATNALNLLKDIVSRNPTQALNILGAQLYNEIITSTYWESRIATSAEASAISVLLATAESRAAQDDAGYEYISGYVRHGQQLGITDPQSLVFFADYQNQNGYTGAENFFRGVRNTYGSVNLSTMYNYSSKNSRRTRTYNFCLSVNWNDYTYGPSPEKDTTAPVIKDVAVSNLTSEGYTVSCTASDNKELTYVYFCVFYKDDGADKAQWYQQTPGSGGTASHTVRISEFSNRAGDYCTFIYAFDASGNYAYVELNIITVPGGQQTASPFMLTVSSETEGRTIRWRAKATGGSGNYQYAFSLYKDGKELSRRNLNDFSDYTFTAEENGTYQVSAAVYDAVSGQTATVMSREVNIFDPIKLSGVVAEVQAAMAGEEIAWNVVATGGEGVLRYSYTLRRNGELVSSTGYSLSTRFSHKPTEGGVYSMTVSIMDSRSQVVSASGIGVTVIAPMTVKDVAFSKSYAIAGTDVACTVDVSGGTGLHTCVFTIYCDGKPIITSEELYSDEFTFTVPSSGSYTASVKVTDADLTTVTATGGKMTADNEPMKGDTNLDGRITASDARIALRCSAKLESVPEGMMKAFDVNGDGKVTASDARKILRVSANLEKF